MTKFNPNILIDPLGGLETQFGVPKCMIDLTKDALSLLPGGILGGMAASTQEGKMAAQNAMASIFENIHDKLGILEYDTLTGKLSLIGDSSQYGVDGFSKSVLGDITHALSFAGGAGAALWQAGQNVMDEFKAIENCLEDFQKWLDKGDNKSNFTSVEEAQTQIARTKGEFFVLKAQALAAEDFIKQANTTLNNISLIMGERSENPDLIPIFAPDDIPLEEISPIFRLTFGPPKAKVGQYLLSVDGIYYDSQTRTYADGSPVPTEHDLTFVPAKDRWKLDHSPNLGGKGTSYSIKDLNQYVNTLFDINKIDSGRYMQNYYEADHFLEVLESQKNQSISNLTKNIVELQYEGYGPDSALRINYTEQIKSQNAAFNGKINKRKKQIEVAVKAPDLFGSETHFSPGEIPINNFSYLSSINLTVEIEKQKNLVFDQGDISGIVLPIVPTFVHSQGAGSRVVLTPLEVPPTGAGSNIDGELLQEVTPILSLTTGISTEGLQAVYNFADTNVQTPDSLEFKTLNCIALGTENRAQTVSTNLSKLYRKGLGIPYLAGIPIIDKENANYEFKGETWDTYPFTVAGVGNYVKLPDTSSYQNLLYSREGATIDVWTYIPGLKKEENTKGFSSHPYETSAFAFDLSSDLGNWCDAHYYRVLLGCENTGGENLNLDQSSVTIDRNSTNVRGMVMGFSRDPRMYCEQCIVQPADTDWNPRQNFGWPIGSVDSISSIAEVKGINGVWTLSSLPGNPLPIAVRQASGTYKTVLDDAGGLPANINFTVTDAGDGYTSSSNEACCVFYVSGYRGATDYGPSAVSSILNIPQFSNDDITQGAGSSVFFIAPTQSYNTSAVGFVKNTDCKLDTADILRFVVSTDKIVDTVDFSDITSQFVNLQIVFDTPNNLIKFYVNSVLLKQQSLSEVFGVPKGSAPQIPSFMMPKDMSTSSFYYSKNTVNQKAGVNVFDAGPNTYPRFTPWIVGGGWTDGRPISLDTSSGGFLDTGAGLISPYNGYIGNLKIYNRALNTTELRKNYKAQRNFFSNLDLTETV